MCPVYKLSFRDVFLLLLFLAARNPRKNHPKPSGSLAHSLDLTDLVHPFPMDIGHALTEPMLPLLTDGAAHRDQAGTSSKDCAFCLKFCCKPTQTLPIV